MKSSTFTYVHWQRYDSDQTAQNLLAIKTEKTHIVLAMAATTEIL